MARYPHATALTRRLVVLALAAMAAMACGGDTAAPAPPSATTTASAAATSTLATGDTSAPSVLTGAAPGEVKNAAIKVAAASDLRTVMTKIQPAIERACETKIIWVFGSSGQLATQIAAGADFGLLLSADAQYPADLVRAGAVVPNGTASYGVGRVVLATRVGLEPVTDLKALAGRTDMRKIAIANPEHAPYGRAAEQALRNAGVWDQVRDRLVLGENIRQTTDYVEQGNADAGIVAYALVIGGSPSRWTLIDEALHLPMVQGGAVIKGAKAELTGRCVMQYILDPAGQAALKEFGFGAVKR